MDKVSRKILVNGRELTLAAPPQARLLDVLREHIRLTGTKEGCGEGECGACSVLLNEQVVNSCLVLFGQLLDGDRLVTVEGLGDEHHLCPLQDCFITEVGAQCGMCTPGMLIAAHALLMKNPNPSREEIAVALAGNLCRCTGYVKIIDAVEKAARILRGEGGDV
jgi:carbon-monoxide dehydrogenase small subunit